MYSPTSLRGARRATKQSKTEIASALLGTQPRNDGVINRIKLQQKLLAWYHANKRPLPWRLNGNPYRIFVVEVMLQQTQIKTVLPYYERWLKIFPDVHSLARAPLDKVLKLWEGLGYYSRARNLHKAAKMIVEQFGGKIPDDLESLRTLPGIGRYTAGAIASIAFQKPVPLVDGNVFRVLSRIYNCSDDITKPETHHKFYDLAEQLIPPLPKTLSPSRGRGKGEGEESGPGNFNQALMELGSLVCFPDVPNCPSCPVKSLCLSLKFGDPTKLPVKKNGLKIKKIEMVVGLLKKENKILVRRRPPSGIWGGLWEFPGTIRKKGENLEEALSAEFQNEIGISLQILKKAKPIEHRFTHRLAKIYPFECGLRKNRNGSKFKNRNLKWADRRSLKKLSFPVPHQKILLNASMPFKSF